MKRLGLDYTFAYCWYVHANPTPQQAIAAQLDYIRKTREMGILPEIVTVSQGWSGWNDEGTIWRIPPAQYKELLEKAKAVISTFPAAELGSKMLLLDNWNEWSEGHYLAPHQEYGFGYLDAIREVFSDAPKGHIDLLPRDLRPGALRRGIQAVAQRKEVSVLSHLPHAKKVKDKWGTTVTFLLILFIATGLLMIVLALPLVYRKIPPNHLYGFRVKRTLENREVWFEANAFAGQRLAWVGLATVAAAIIFYVLPIANIAAYATAVASVEMVGLLVAVVQSFRYLYGELGQSSGSADSNENARS